MNSHLTVGQILDGYQLIRFLGRGGFGEVWLCRSEATVTYHALKFISGSDADLIEKEHHSLGLYRSAAARLRSPHLVPIEHINRHAAGLYYVMPLADGITDVDPADPDWQPQSLASRFEAQVSATAWFSSQDIIALIHPLLDALQSLSDAGLIHRDVKPDNILFFSGSPCLGDISLLGEDAAVITRRGTPGYATPSWYQGGLPDMYGAAATLYTLLTGNPPDKMGRAAFLWPPQGEASLPESERTEWKRLHAVIRRATEEKVGERYVDFRAMAASVAAAETPGRPAFPPPNPERPATQSKKSPTLPLILAALLVIGIVVVIFTNLSGSNQPPTAPPVAENPSAPAATSGRKPKIVDSQGYYKSLRERVIEVIPAAISAAPSENGPRYDLSNFRNQSGILKAYQSRDYTGCLDLLNARIKDQPTLLKNPLCLLLKALLYKQLSRESDMQAALQDFRKLPREESSAAGMNKTGLSMRMTLLEALNLHEEAEKYVAAAIKTARAELMQFGPTPDRQNVLTVMLLYRDRARTHILQGDMAGALADEHAALELPPGIVPAGSPETPEEARQIHLNTIVMEWELLEQEFSAYADYLEANGWPEPKPDHRNLKAID
jgi:serine/threonine protein kinase